MEKEYQRIEAESIAKVKAEKNAIEKERRQREERIAKLQAETEGIEKELQKLEEERKQCEKALAEERAKREMVPSARVVATINGREVTGAKLSDGKKDYLTPFSWTLENGKRYGPYAVSCKSGGRRYYGTFDAVMVNWTGPKTFTVALKEYTGPNHGDTKTLTLPGGAKMVMIYVEPGEFMMGSRNGGVDESPVHKVRLTKGYWLGKYEVTQKQWRSVMGSNPSAYKGDDRPVENVSWNDCQEFAREVNSRLNCGARLPTEAEWEYACRAGTTGDYAGKLDNMAWYSDNSGSWRTHPVGTKSPNAYGFYDMHGNVWEWCYDRFGDYSHGLLTDPTGAATGVYRVFRGGCWGSVGRGCQSAHRDRAEPDLRNLYSGFRLCCSAVPSE